MRSVILVAVPSFAAIIGFFWFWRKRRPPGISNNMKKEEHTKEVPTLASISGEASCPLIPTLSPVKDQVFSDHADASDNCVTACMSCSGDGPLTTVLKELEATKINMINEAGDGHNELEDEPLNCVSNTSTLYSHTPQSNQTLSTLFDLEDNQDELAEEESKDIAKSTVNNNYKNECDDSFKSLSDVDHVDVGSKLWSDMSKVSSHYEHEESDADNFATSSMSNAICIEEGVVNIELEHVEVDAGKGGVMPNLPDALGGQAVAAMEAEVAQVTGSLTRSNSHSPAVGSPVENVSVTSSNGSGSDVPSEASADSGHGASLADVGSPPAKESHLPDPTIYDFEFPTRLCGKLIGKNGRNISVIKERSGADISVQRNPYTPDLQIVHLEGSKTQVYCALDMVKQRFPPRKFRINYASLEPTAAVEACPVLPAEIMQLNLPEGCTVDVLISSVVTPNHVFLQQPTHPTFPMLERQTQCMLLCYTQDTIVPQLPRPIDVGTVCAAPMFNGWYRAQVVETYLDTDEAYIRFVDYGGYMRMQACLLRQIRSDFTTLPFQAIECYMANVVPPGEVEDFSVEANVVMEQMVHGKLLQAEVVGHEADATPYIQVYIQQADNTMVLLNRELVDRGVARWLEHPV